MTAPGAAGGTRHGTSDEPVPGPGPDDVADRLARVVASVEPVPPGWHGAATDAYVWASIGAAPGRLVHDTHAVRGDGDHVPGWGTALRAVRYDAGTAAVDLELDVGADKVQLAGRLTPARATEVTVLWPGGRRVVTSDEQGRFRAEELPRRPLCVVTAGSPALKSGWIVA